MLIEFALSMLGILKTILIVITLSSVFCSTVFVFFIAILEGNHRKHQIRRALFRKWKARKYKQQAIVRFEKEMEALAAMTRADGNGDPDMFFEQIKEIMDAEEAALVRNDNEDLGEVAGDPYSSGGHRIPDHGFSGGKSHNQGN